MRTVLHIPETEACELLAETLQRLNGGVYKVTATVTSGYYGNPLDSAPASVRFEATEIMSKPSEASQ